MTDGSGRRRSRWSGAFLVLVVVPTALWFTGAVWFQSSPPWRYLALAIPWAVAFGVVGMDRTRGPAIGWACLAAAIAVGALWWNSIKPSNDLDWAPDVARGVTAEIGEREVVVHNIRAFDWITKTRATEHWKSERYDPDTITSLDLVSSVWDSPAIAHTLVTFGFADGRHLAFSAETRRRTTQEFSTLGGFFKEFEIVLLAAEETDILRLRTNVRKESVSLFPLGAKRENVKALFLTYLATGNALAREPAFYNTLTTNCTTVIFDLARHIGSKVRYDWRILVTGYLPDFLYEEGLIRTGLSLLEMRRAALISALGQSAPPDADYSAVIRSGPLFRDRK